MKYFIKLETGELVEGFTKCSVIVTNNINIAGKYTKAIANKRLLNLNIKGVLIPIN
jgi:hypothetical protein